jgi:integrase
MDDLRMSARDDCEVLLRPEQVRILMSPEVYPALAKLEALALSSEWRYRGALGCRASLAGLVSERSSSRTHAPPSVDDLLDDWLEHHVANLAAPERYRHSVDHWRTFVREDKREGHRKGDLNVADLTPELQRRFRSWRAAAGVGGHTINRDLAALRGALSWAWKHQRISRPPFIADVPIHLLARPRDRILSFEEIARIVATCDGRPDREHLIRFIVIELGTAGRPQAVLELTDANIDLERDLIDPNQPGRNCIRKRRAIVPIAKAVRPWVTGVSGKLIKYRVATSGGEAGTGFFERETKSIRRCWNSVCREASVSGATPKTLRHTMLTWLAERGVPPEQRRMLAGHSAQGTTARNYEHLSPTYLRAAIEEVDAFFIELRKHTPALDRQSA